MAWNTRLGKATLQGFSRYLSYSLALASEQTNNALVISYVQKAITTTTTTNIIYMGKGDKGLGT